MIIALRGYPTPSPIMPGRLFSLFGIRLRFHFDSTFCLPSFLSLFFANLH